VKTGTSALTGLIVALLCWSCGVDLPVLWGLLAFLLNYIPNIGSVIAAVPPVLLALVQHGPGVAMGVAAGYLAVNFTVGNMLEPRLMGRALGLSPLVVFLSMLVWGWMLGPVGALFSAPLTMILKHWLAHTPDLTWIAVLLGPASDVPPAPASPADAP
jgi:predicted PurR-regulated permease PerM